MEIRLLKRELRKKITKQENKKRVNKNSPWKISCTKHLFQKSETVVLFV